MSESLLISEVCYTRGCGFLVQPQTFLVSALENDPADDGELESLDGQLDHFLFFLYARNDVCLVLSLSMTTPNFLSRLDSSPDLPRNIYGPFDST